MKIVLALLFVLSLVLVALQILLRVRSSAAAKKIVGNLYRMWATPHEVRPASLAEFSHCDPATYAAATEFFAGRGFRSLGDYEDLTISAENPLMRTALRILVAHAAVAELYEIDVTAAPAARRSDLPDRRFVVTVKTELEDGRAIATGNTYELDRIEAPPSVEYLRLPLRTTAAEILRAHDARVAEVLRQFPELRTRSVTTYEEVRAQGERLRLAMFEHRKSIRWLTREEFMLLAGPGQEKAADMLWPHVQSELSSLPRT